MKIATWSNIRCYALTLAFYGGFLTHEIMSVNKFEKLLNKLLNIL